MSRFDGRVFACGFFLSGAAVMIALVFASSTTAQCDGCGWSEPNANCGDSISYCVARDDGTGTAEQPFTSCAYDGTGLFIIDLSNGIPGGPTSQCKSRITRYNDGSPPVHPVIPILGG